MSIFSREPAEKKAFWKAFGSALSKPSSKTFSELDSACNAWPTGWQGYLLMGLSYDLASGVEFDPEKAKAFHYKAKEAGEKAGDKFPALFYEVYETPAINFKTDTVFFPRTLNMRRAGSAMLLNYYSDEKQIFTNAVFKGDLEFWDKLFSHIDTGGMFKSSDEQIQVFNHREAFVNYLRDYAIYNKPNKDEQAIIENTNTLIKHVNKMIKKSPYPSHTDLWFYVMGFSQLMGGAPYDFRGDSYYEDIRVNGFINLWRAAVHGGGPAVHLLMDMIDNSELEGLVYFAYSRAMEKSGAEGLSSKKSARLSLLRYLKLCADKGDQIASVKHRKLYDQCTELGDLRDGIPTR